MSSIIGIVGSLIIGSVVASVTVVGLVNAKIDSASNSPGKVSDPTSQISYGS